MNDIDDATRLESVEARVAKLESLAVVRSETTSMAGKVIGATVGSVAAVVVVWLLILLAYVVTRWALR